MKNTDKVTLTLGQLKQLVTEATFYSDEEEKTKRTERNLLNRIENEYRNGYFGTALDLIIDYRRNHIPYFKSDFDYWEKRCRDELI